MKFVKTATANRGTYTYTFIDVDGESKNVELVPGKDGVTAAHIKMLHSLDDAEVYNNIKNCKPAVQEWEKSAIEDWKDKHPNEELPKRWNISINEIVGEDENVSREEYLKDERTEELPESDMIARLHEIIDSLSELQKETYRKVILEEMSNTSVAAEENKSEAAVRKIINRIKQIIAEDDELKKYFQ